MSEIPNGLTFLLMIAGFVGLGIMKKYIPNKFGNDPKPTYICHPNNIDGRKSLNTWPSGHHTFF